MDVKNKNCISRPLEYLLPGNPPPWRVCWVALQTKLLIYFWITSKQNKRSTLTCSNLIECGRRNGVLVKLKVYRYVRRSICYGRLSANSYKPMEENLDYPLGRYCSNNSCHCFQPRSFPYYRSKRLPKLYSNAPTSIRSIACFNIYIGYEDNERVRRRDVGYFDHIVHKNLMPVFKNGLAL